jgi:poly(A) polymerase
MPPLDPDAQLEFAKQVVAKLRAAGFEAYWAGGCVRDRLLGLTPKDYDVATDARPDEIRHLFGERRTLPIGAAFGVITVLGAKAAGQIEVATFRADAEYSDGRRPDSVTFSNAREDALRRDFTINGMFLDPLAEEVLDYVGGRIDLEDHLLRAIGDPHARIREDKLRMLRAVRFAAHFGFALEHQTKAAIQQSAPDVKVVSAERITQELRRMWVDSHRVRALELLQETELLPVILPEIAELADAPPIDLAEGPCDPWHYLLRVVGALDSPNFSLTAAALLHLLPAAAVEKLGRRLKWARKEIDEARWLVAHHADWQGARALPWPRLQRLLIAPLAEDWLNLAHALALTGRGELADVQHCRQKRALPSDVLNPAPLLNGHDLAELGLPEGRRVALLLEQLRDLQLDGRLATRADALSYAKQLLLKQ